MGDLCTLSGRPGIQELVPPPTVNSGKLLGLTLASAIAVVISLDIRIDPQNGAE